MDLCQQTGNFADQGHVRRDILSFQKQQLRDMVDNNRRLRELMDATLTGDEIANVTLQSSEFENKGLKEIETEQVSLLKQGNIVLQSLMNARGGNDPLEGTNISEEEYVTAEDEPVTPDEGGRGLSMDDKIPTSSSIALKQKKKPLKGKPRRSLRERGADVFESDGETAHGVDSSYRPNKVRRNKRRKATSTPFAESQWTSSDTDSSPFGGSPKACGFCKEKFAKLGLLLQHRSVCKKLQKNEGADENQKPNMNQI